MTFAPAPSGDWRQRQYSTTGSSEAPRQSRGLQRVSRGRVSDLGTLLLTSIPSRLVERSYPRCCKRALREVRAPSSRAALHGTQKGQRQSPTESRVVTDGLRNADVTEPGVPPEQQEAPDQVRLCRTQETRKVQILQGCRRNVDAGTWALWGPSSSRARVQLLLKQLEAWRAAGNSGAGRT